MTRLDKPVPGKSTAMPLNVSYRVDRIADLISGRWLDLGCAEGGYTAELLRRGATEVIGIDADETRVAQANSRNLPGASFRVALGEDLPFPAEDFDGVFMNEVLEHVRDEEDTLAEIVRVLRPGGRLVLISPNRWFPFEGHGMRTSHFSTETPVPLLPWLPQSLAGRWMAARNYWPRELLKYVRNAGLSIERFGFIWPVLEFYPWLPSGLRDGYQARIRFFDSVPVLRRFGVSTLIVGRKLHSP
jgi:SAM-dependent methyltransferase